MSIINCRHLWHMYNVTLMPCVGNTNWGGRVSTVDLLIKVTCFMKMKKSWSKLVSTRRSTVLILALSKTSLPYGIVCVLFRLIHICKGFSGRTYQIPCDDSALASLRGTAQRVMILFVFHLLKWTGQIGDQKSSAWLQIFLPKNIDNVNTAPCFERMCSDK